jgi:proteic killer suppression protein
VIAATRLDLTPKLHPLITAVTALVERGGVSACVVHERVPLGPLRIPNRYRAARRVSGAEVTLVELMRSGAFSRPDVQRRAHIKLLMLDAAAALQDLFVARGNRLEKLAGDRAGQYSIRINDQWRICFRWTGRHAYEVEICDYH